MSGPLPHAIMAGQARAAPFSPRCPVSATEVASTDPDTMAGRQGRQAEPEVVYWRCRSSNSADRGNEEVIPNLEIIAEGP